MHLGINSIGDEGVKALCDACKSSNCKLTELILWRNEITDRGVGYLNENCKLMKLHLSNNKITDRSVEYLNDALKSKHCKYKLN